MTTEEVTDYTSLSYIKLCFAEDTFLHAQFEQDYSREIKDELDELFTSPTRTKVHTKCFDKLTAMITSTILDDEDTLGDPTHIKSILDKTLRIRAKLKKEYSGRIRTWKDLKNILNRAVLTQTPVIEIVIGFKGLQPDPNFKHNHIHWDHYSLTPYDEDTEGNTKSEPPTAPSPSLTDIAAEFAKVVSATQANAPAPISATDIATEVAKAVTTESSKMISTIMQSQTQASTYTPSSTAGSSHVSSTGTHLFSTTNLPTDVLTRYQAREQEKPIIKSDLQPYHSGYLHHMHGTGQIILLDGNVFPLIPINEKAFRLSFPSLTGLDDESIRQWYLQATRHCHQHGVYMHGYWCFRKTANNLRGFTIGNATTDDLPAPLTFLVSRSTSVLYNILLTALPDPATHPIIKDALGGKNQGQGHHVLKTLITDSHPNFVHMPHTLVSSAPEQGQLESLSYYFTRYEDYLQLSSYIKNTPCSLDDPDHIDVLLNGITNKYNQYLQTHTFHERQDPSLIHQYKKDTLLATLKSKLQQPDSPTLHKSKSSAFGPLSHQRSPTNLNQRSPTNPRRNPYHQRSPRGTPVNHLTIAEDHELDQACDDIYNVTPPPDPDEAKTFTKYAVTINKIATNQRLAYSQPCLICEGIHDFANCPVLQNHEFLKTHYITFMQMIKKHEKARNACQDQPASTPRASTPTGANVYHIQCTNPDDQVYVFPPISPAPSPALVTDDGQTNTTSNTPTSDFSTGHP